MMMFWIILSATQTLIGVTASIIRQKRKVYFQEFLYLIIGGFCLFLFSPIAGIIAGFLVVDKMRAKQIEKRDLACTDEGRAIRSMLKASQIRMGKPRL